MHLLQSKIIELREVSVTFDKDVILDNITFSIDEGDFVAITGPNGGGKTTLLRIILKLLKPTKGSVNYRWMNKEVKTLPIGYLPQKNMIDTSFPITVGEVVSSGLQQGLRAKIDESSRNKICSVIEMMGIENIVSRPIKGLSGGQLQRTLLGRALVSEPKVLVLDEPLSYVDKQFEKQIYGIMEKLAQQTTIILVSHEMSIISGMASRHIIVDHGLRECSALHHYIPNQCN